MRTPPHRTTVVVNELTQELMIPIAGGEETSAAHLAFAECNPVSYRKQHYSLQSVSIWSPLCVASLCCCWWYYILVFYCWAADSQLM